MIRMREPDSSVARFRPGDLVEHVRYGYRGVVVAFDATCQATDEWYDANQTKPRRDQPWYHVLVDGATHSTYAAQQNLRPDTAGGPVRHPLVERYFRSFAGQRYERNELLWGV